jgi:hypothetical protein
MVIQPDPTASEVADPTVSNPAATPRFRCEVSPSAGPDCVSGSDGSGPLRVPVWETVRITAWDIAQIYVPGFIQEARQPANPFYPFPRPFNHPKKRMRHQSHPSWPPRESRRNLSAPTSLHAARSMPYQRIGALVLSGPHIENPRPSNRAPPHLQAAGPCQSRLPRLATPSRSRTLRKKTRPTESPGTMVIADGLWDPAVRYASSIVRPPDASRFREPFRTLAV